MGVVLLAVLRLIAELSQVGPRLAIRESLANSNHER